MEKGEVAMLRVFHNLLSWNRYRLPWLADILL